MLISYFKGLPTDHIIKFVGGKVKKEGRGISFFYWKPSATIMCIPTKTVDAPFIFLETTRTFQQITIQGQLTYRIAQPQRISSLLDFSIDPCTRKYVSDDPEKLWQRIVNAAQMATRGQVQELPLDETLRKSEQIARVVLEALKKDSTLDSIGVECLSVYFTAIKPTPELSKALEAEYREALQKKADEAIYSRRAAAVEQERKIKENEMDSQIALERAKQELVDLDGANVMKRAEYNSKAMETSLAPFRSMDPKLLVAMGIKALGESASRIGNLTITPDLLTAILEERNVKA